MRPSQIRRALQRLFASPPQAPAPEALEQRLMARYDTQFPAAASGSRWGRFVLGGILGGVVLVGACRVPVEYDLDLGARVGIFIDGDRRDEVDVHGIVDHVNQVFSPEELEVSVEMRKEASEDGEHVTMMVQLDMVGEDVDADELWAELESEFPWLEGARMEPHMLRGTVRGTLGGKLSHEFLDVIIDKHGTAEARRRVLEELNRQGFSGDAKVEIVDEGGRRGVKIELRETKELEP